MVMRPSGHPSLCFIVPILSPYPEWHWSWSLMTPNKRASFLIIWVNDRRKMVPFITFINVSCCTQKADYLDSLKSKEINVIDTQIQIQPPRFTWSINQTDRAPCVSHTPLQPPLLSSKVLYWVIWLGLSKPLQATFYRPLALKNT